MKLASSSGDVDGSGAAALMDAWWLATYALDRCVAGPPSEEVAGELARLIGPSPVTVTEALIRLDEIPGLEPAVRRRAMELLGDVGLIIAACDDEPGPADSDRR